MKFKIELTKQNLSSFGGASVVEEVMTKIRFDSLYASTLPVLKYKGAQDSLTKLKAMTCSFISDCDCLDDIEHMNYDPAYVELMNQKVYSAKTYGNYLRSFTGENIYELQNATIKMNLMLRSQLEESFINDGKIKSDVVMLDCDSTKNRQYGELMEGVEINHEKVLSLDTQNIFDELGFQYHIDVRPGATHTSFGAGPAVAHVVRQIKTNNNYTDRKFWVRADSGYYGAKFINSLLAVGADIILAVNKGKYFRKIVGQVHNWTEQDPNDKNRIKFYDGRECEIGSTNYRITDCQRRLRYVLIRAKKSSAGTLFEDHVEYEYFAFCTTLDELRISDYDLIVTYRGRGQAENFIKEMKYGFDLKHYPCAKLMANKAYAAIASIAYNIMRFIGLMQVDGFTNGKPRFSKHIRKHLLSIPCLVARTGRDRKIKLMHHHLQRVTAWLKQLKNMHVGFLDCYT